jgi:hypothetical protein
MNILEVWNFSCLEGDNRFMGWPQLKKLLILLLFTLQLLAVFT